MRRRILDAAKTLFVREGFENVSMRRIASAIEYSPAALYRYFPSKRDMLTVLREEGFQRFVTAQRALRDTCPDPLERLRVGGRDYIRFAIAEPEYFHLMFRTGCREVDMGGERALMSRESFELFRGTVEACVESGRFGGVSVWAAVLNLWSVIHGMADLVTTGRVAALTACDDLDQLLDEILVFGLRPTK